jgi:hypothetical protein
VTDKRRSLWTSQIQVDRVAVRFGQFVSPCKISWIIGRKVTNERPILGNGLKVSGLIFLGRRKSGHGHHWSIGQLGTILAAQQSKGQF